MQPERALLDLAARLAWRGAGHVEPNPMVGAVIVDTAGRVIGLGHHEEIGQWHAERHALEDCRRRGIDPRGATMYVTLEPCDTQGRQPPCTQAILRSGLARVVAARRDPHALKGGGADRLRSQGLDVVFSDASPMAIAVGAPYAKRTVTGLPWVVAKWAQTQDGDTRRGPDGSRWISGEAARRRVHRLRARMDAIVTGMGTVLADDPLLIARGVRTRRVARRVVVTTRGALPEGRILMRTAPQFPLTIATLPEPRDGDQGADAAPTGVDVLRLPAADDLVDLRAMLRELVRRHDTATVLLEAGETLMTESFEEGVVDEAIVFLAGAAELAPEPPRLQGAMGPFLRRDGPFTLWRARPVGADLEIRYVRREAFAASAPPE